MLQTVMLPSPLLLPSLLLLLLFLLQLKLRALAVVPQQALCHVSRDT